MNKIERADARASLSPWKRKVHPQEKVVEEQKAVAKKNLPTLNLHGLRGIPQKNLPSQRANPPLRQKIRRSKKVAGKSRRKNQEIHQIKERIRLNGECNCLDFYFSLFGSVACSLVGMCNHKLCHPIAVFSMAGATWAGVETMLQAVASPSAEFSYILGGWTLDLFPESRIEFGRIYSEP